MAKNKFVIKPDPRDSEGPKLEVAFKVDFAGVQNPELWLDYIEPFSYRFVRVRIDISLIGKDGVTQMVTYYPVIDLQQGFNSLVPVGNREARKRVVTSVSCYLQLLNPRLFAGLELEHWQVQYLLAEDLTSVVKSPRDPQYAPREAPNRRFFLKGFAQE